MYVEQSLWHMSMYPMAAMPLKLIPKMTGLEPELNAKV